MVTCAKRYILSKLTSHLLGPIMEVRRIRRFRHNRSANTEVFPEFPDNSDDYGVIKTNVATPHSSCMIAKVEVRLIWRSEILSGGCK